MFTCDADKAPLERLFTAWVVMRLRHQADELAVNSLPEHSLTLWWQDISDAGCVGDELLCRRSSRG